MTKDNKQSMCKKGNEREKNAFLGKMFQKVIAGQKTRR